MKRHIVDLPTVKPFKANSVTTAIVEQFFEDRNVIYKKHHVFERIYIVYHSQTFQVL